MRKSGTGTGTIRTTVSSVLRIAEDAIVETHNIPWHRQATPVISLRPDAALAAERVVAMSYKIGPFTLDELLQIAGRLSPDVNVNAQEGAGPLQALDDLEEQLAHHSGNFSLAAAARTSLFQLKCENYHGERRVFYSEEVVARIRDTAASSSTGVPPGVRGVAVGCYPCADSHAVAASLEVVAEQGCGNCGCAAEKGLCDGSPPPERAALAVVCPLSCAQRGVTTCHNRPYQAAVANFAATGAYLDDSVVAGADPYPRRRLESTDSCGSAATGAATTAPPAMSAFYANVRQFDRLQTLTTKSFDTTSPKFEAKIARILTSLEQTFADKLTQIIPGAGSPINEPRPSAGTKDLAFQAQCESSPREYEIVAGHIGCHDTAPPYTNYGYIGRPEDFLEDTAHCIDASAYCVLLGKQACDTAPSCWGFGVHNGWGVQLYNAEASRASVCSGSHGLHPNTGWTTYVAKSQLSEHCAQFGQNPDGCFNAGCQYWPDSVVSQIVNFPGSAPKTINPNSCHVCTDNPGQISMHQSVKANDCELATNSCACMNAKGKCPEPGDSL